MALAIFPILFLLIGIGLWAIPDKPRAHPKINEAGRLMFAISFAILLWMLRTHVAHLG